LCGWRPLIIVLTAAATKPSPQPAALAAITGRLPQLSMAKMDNTTAAKQKMEQASKPDLIVSHGPDAQ
jgi:hypothetical protein